MDPLDHEHQKKAANKLKKESRKLGDALPGLFNANKSGNARNWIMYVGVAFGTYAFYSMLSAKAKGADSSLAHSVRPGIEHRFDNLRDEMHAAEARAEVLMDRSLREQPMDPEPDPETPRRLQ
jgi:hypothetical protein